MKTLLPSVLLAAVVLAVSATQAAVSVGQPAPNFTAMDTNGKTVSLSDYKGKVVVLEWTNPECPIVKKHYGSGNMQKLQKTYTAEGVVWLSINSSARGKEGALTPAEANNVITARSAAPTSLILDPSGAIGHLYEAKTTPHMFIIAKDGRLVYNGAIDSISSTSPDDISRAKNYVSAALDEVLAGKPVTVASSRPYGCSVHY